VKTAHRRVSLDFVLGTTLALGTFLLLWATLGDPGMAWDEGFTVQREETVRIWFREVWRPGPGNDRGRMFQSLTLERLWPFSREEPDGHPPLYALLGNAGWLLTHSWLPPLQAYRVGPALLFAVTVGVLCTFLSRRVSRLAGLTAGLSWVLMPRVFAHAHFASYDIPLACLWVLAAVTFWRAGEPCGWREAFGRAIAFSVLLSLAAGTKFTGWLIPLPLAAWSVWNGTRRRGDATSERSGQPGASHSPDLCPSRPKGDQWNAPRWLPLAAASLPLVIGGPTVLRGIRELSRRDRLERSRPGAADDLMTVPRRVADGYRASVPSRVPGWPLFLAGPLLAGAMWWRERMRHTGPGALPVGLPELWTTIVAFAPTLTLMLNPPWWHDPLQGITVFLWSNLSRRSSTWIPTQFFGTTYEFALPWYNALTWTFLTVPPGILGLALVGVGGAVRELWQWRRGPGSTPGTWPPGFAAFWLCHAATLLVIRSLPSAPGHDGDRQLQGAFPFVACLAGLGVAGGAAWLRRRCSERHGQRAAAGFAGLVLLWAGVAVWRYHPLQLSYYSESVGGLPGAARLGLEPTYYWDALTDDALAWLNQRTAPGEKVLFCSMPLSFEYLRRWDKLRAAILPFEPGAWKWYVLQNRPGLFTGRPQDAWLAQHGRPAAIWARSGVPLLWIFPISEYERAYQETRNATGGRRGPAAEPGDR
jgi:hypothetical protein